MLENLFSIFSRKSELKSLIRSFQNFLTEAEIQTIEDNVEYNESGLALETLCDAIYENNIAVNAKQEAEILRLSKIYGIDESYHKFIGKIPPYPDLRTAKQKELEKELENKLQKPSLESIKYLASKGFFIDAVKMHRELFRSDLEEATKKVRELVE